MSTATPASYELLPRPEYPSHRDGVSQRFVRYGVWPRDSIFTYIKASTENPAVVTLNHFHCSRADTIPLIAHWVTQDRQDMIEGFRSMIESVERCVASYRAYTIYDKDSRDAVVHTWMDNERQADEALIKSLEKAYVQTLLQKPQTQFSGIRDFSFRKPTETVG